MTKAEQTYLLLKTINTQDFGNNIWGTNWFYGDITAKEVFGEDFSDEKLPVGHYVYIYTDTFEPPIIRHLKKLGGFFGEEDFHILTTVSKHGSPIYLYRL